MKDARCGMKIEIVDRIGFGLIDGWGLNREICDYNFTHNGDLVIMCPDPRNYDSDIFFVCRNWINKGDEILILDLREINEKEWSNYLS